MMDTVRKFTYVLALFMLLSTKSFAFSPIQIDTTRLAIVKQNIYDGTASERTINAYKALLKKADKWLITKNPTVINKTILPPTGNKHDYLSLSRYWWPNPETPDGLPWIRKDGETNPETQTDAVDRQRLGAMTKGVKNLSLAYYFSDDERYAEKAVSMLKTWFLDEETLMHPNLEFAQGVPGISNGKPSGVLDGKSIPTIVPEAIAILSNSPFWTKNDTEKINKWLTDYLTWLTESELGHIENNQKNNHGSWYKFQVSTLALYLGNETLTKETVSLAQQSLETQLDFEGKQIHELARTRSFFYSCYNLNALTSIAIIGDQVGMDMWNYNTKDDKSLGLAVNYLSPVINGKAWPYTDIHGVDLSGLLPTLVRMSKHSESKEYIDLLSKTTTILIEKEKSTGIKNQVLEELILTGYLNI
ncbi:alginate lyase family protein [Formosa sp. PL04]|uniref:alginate lyase family protein n=1 Tax=Formosa sp. PL04 TaxID=3081755 RepID=UPI002980AFAD|nr:alginate lyase family protein [Formosa sp. PL04]MDW5289631.1 alginate lyase family protein [Formosa sp. PL04]